MFWESTKKAFDFIRNIVIASGILFFTFLGEANLYDSDDEAVIFSEAFRSNRFLINSSYDNLIIKQVQREVGIYISGSKSGRVFTPTSYEEFKNNKRIIEILETRRKVILKANGFFVLSLDILAYGATVLLLMNFLSYPMSWAVIAKRNFYIKLVALAIFTILSIAATSVTVNISYAFHKNNIYNKNIDFREIEKYANYIGENEYTSHICIKTSIIDKLKWPID